ncbi:MAG: hypothetical protein JSS14_19470 [Proteobacteria bacterium]|nr:hypothetical protein [Pseudomonadota bacterium]
MRTSDPLPLFERSRLRPVLAAASLMLLLLAGCQAPSGPRPLGPDVPPPPQMVDAFKCNAGESRFALGQVMTPALLDEARDRTGARSAVTVKAGESPSPADPMRLLIQVDGQGKMDGARCG